MCIVLPILSSSTTFHHVPNSKPVNKPKLLEPTITKVPLIDSFGFQFKKHVRKYKLFVNTTKKI